MRLLIHHHAVAFLDVEGAIWLPSFISRWVVSLAPFVREVNLLMAYTYQRSQRQDERIQEANVKLTGLYCIDKQKSWNFVNRAAQTARACQTAKGDVLLIRGVTPRQMLVWTQASVPTERKAFMLVGSLAKKEGLRGSGLHRAYAFLVDQIRPKQIKLMANHGTLMLANSPGLVDEVIALTGKNAVFVPTSSIREDEFSALSVRSLSNHLKLLFVGRVTRDKGVIELIRALSLPAAATWTLDIVGPVSQSDKTFFEILARETNTTDRIRWHGKVNYGPDLFSWYRRADLLIVPSYHEGFPHVIWEAASQSCPVIATAVGGIPALWQHREHGLLIEARSGQAIVNAALELLQYPDLVSRTVTQAYQHAQHYTVEKCAKRLVDELGSSIL